MRVRVLAVAAGFAMLAGCLPTQPNLPPQEYYVLNDLSGTGASGIVTPTGRALLVGPTSTSPFYDTQSLAYSRAAGQRAYYQFSGWAERPGRRFNELLMRRLEARAAFATVASTTAGVKGDLVLHTRIEEFYHDAAASPSVARIEATVEIIDHAGRAIVARRRFAQSAPASANNAPAAVAAFNQALTALLDDIVVWIAGAAGQVAPR